MHAITQDVCPSTEWDIDFTPLSLIIHTTPKVWKLQEPLCTQLHGPDGAFCSTGIFVEQEIIQTLDIGLCLREPDEPHCAWAF